MNRARLDDGVTKPTPSAAEVMPRRPSTAGTAARGGAESAVPLEWQVGDTILDLYEVKDVFISGGMGLVYRVHHRTWNLDLAVKCPRPQYFSTEARKADFVREAETWVDLGLHPHIVTCYYVRTLGGIPRVFAEFVEGGSLKDWIQDRRLYAGGPEKALEYILDIAIQTAWGLGYAHEQDLVHRDVKPANLLMTPHGTPKVTDFGLARVRAAVAEAPLSEGQATLLMSRGGYTPAYCSPEQARGEPLSRSTDVWSWGLSVLEMFTGEVTWLGGQAAAEALQMYLEIGPPEPTIPAMPPALATVLHECFQGALGARPGSMRELAQRLVEIYQQLTRKIFPHEVPEAVKLQAAGLNNKAASLLDLGRASDAEEAWRAALDAEPHHPAATFNSSYWRWQTARTTDEALVRALEALMAGNLADRSVRRYIAWVHLERGDHEAVERVRRELLETDSFGLEESFEAAWISPERPVARQIRSLEGQDGVFTSARWTQDRCVALLTGRPRISAWDVADGHTISNFERHTATVLCSALSQDGRLALTGDRDGVAWLWEIDTGQAVEQYRWLPSSGETRGHAALSSDRRKVLLGGHYTRFWLWDVRSQRPPLSIPVAANSACFSPDGRFVLLGRDDGTLQIWDVENGQMVQEFGRHAGTVNATCFSPDGNHVLSGCDDSTLRLFEVSSGKELCRYEGHHYGVLSLCYSPDGTHALSGGWDATLRLWNISSGRCLVTLRGQAGLPTALCFSPDGCFALSGGQSLVVWELRHGGTQWKAGHPFPVLSRVIVSGKQILQSEQALVELSMARYLLEDGAVVEAHKTLRQRQKIQGYARDDEGQALLAMCGQKARRTALKEAWPVRSFEGHLGAVTSVHLSPDRRLAVSASLDCSIRLWAVDSGRELQRFEPADEEFDNLHKLREVWSVRFLPNGRHLIGRSLLEGFLWDTESARRVRRLLVAGEEMHLLSSIAASPDGQHVFSVTDGGKLLELWEVSSDKRVRTFGWDTAADAKEACFSPDGRQVLTAGQQSVRFWDLTTGHQVLAVTGLAETVCFSPRGRRVLSGGHGQPLRLWDLAQRRLVWQQAPAGWTQPACFSPEGRWILSSDENHALCLWDVEADQAVCRLSGHTAPVTAVCFSQDGRFALSGSNDHSVRLWEFDWEYEFPGPVNWDEGARPYLEIFLSLHTPYGPDGISRAGAPSWTEEDFRQLLTELGYHGYGWLRPEGVKHKLEEMAQQL